MFDMSTVFLSPSRYVQGPDEMNNIGAYAEKYGKKALCLISNGGYRRQGAQIETSFAKSGAAVVFEYFKGECSMTEINRLVDIVKKKGCDVVIGVGGGKIFDTAKAAAYYVGCRSWYARPLHPPMRLALRCLSFILMRAFSRNIYSCRPTPIWC